MSLHFHDSLFAHFSFAQGKSIRCLCFAQLRTSFRLADNVASLADVRRDQRRRGLQVRWSRSWYSPPYSLKSSPASLKIRLSRTMVSRRACSASAHLSRAALAACRISAVSETLRSNSWRHELPPLPTPLIEIDYLRRTTGRQHRVDKTRSGRDCASSLLAIRAIEEVCYGNGNKSSERSSLTSKSMGSCFMGRTGSR